MTNILPRRTFLREAGALLALPFLQAMQPRAAAAAPRDSKCRLVTFNTTLGLHLPNFVPKESGRDYTVTRYLEPLAELREQFTVISGLSHPDVDGGHSSELSFLTGAPHPAAQSFRNTISLDQFAVEQRQPDTRFPFIVLAQARRLEKTLGPQDRETLDQYLSSVRDVEKRLVNSQDWAKRAKPKVNATLPKDPIPADLIGHQQLMLDLVRLAFETDSTRYVTITYGGTGGAVPPIEGVSGEWHGLSHHGQSQSKLDQLSLIELAEMKQLARFLKSLRDVEEEGETLLDRTIVMYGSNLSNASAHDTRNLPFLLAGGGFKHGQHLAFDPARHPPLANLFVSILQRLGVETTNFSSGRSTLSGLEFA